MRTPRPFVLVSLALLGLAGCGWHTGAGPHARDGLEGATYAAGTTVGVELFGRAREVLERNLEPELHAALSRAVVQHAGYPLADASGADLVLRGTVLDYRRRSGVRSEEHVLLETGVRLRVSAELVDRSTGDVLAVTKPHVWSSYALDGVPREAAARERGFDFLARRIVFDVFGSLERQAVPPDGPAPASAGIGDSSGTR